MKISESNKNHCILFNKHSVGYLIVELGSIEHSEAVKKGYEFRGPSYVANITEIDAMSESNKIFMETLTKN
jgi:hypothetical protein